MNHLRRGFSLRRFNKRSRSRGVRPFSMAKVKLPQPEPHFIDFYKNGQKLDVPVASKVDSNHLPKNKKSGKLGKELSFTKDMVFLKFLSSVNLESKERDSISTARILAYNI